MKKRMVAVVAVIAAIVLLFEARAQACGLLGPGRCACDAVNITAEPDVVTNLPIETVEGLLPETLRPYARQFCEGEKEYGVNMLFVMAIAREETGLGAAGVGREHKHNLFGVKGKDGYRVFEDYGKSIENEFRMICEVYFDSGRTSISGIAALYCPDTAGDWAGKVLGSTEAYAAAAMRG